MGCRCSKAAKPRSRLQSLLQRQSTHIEGLNQTNAELRRIVETLIAENQKQRTVATTAVLLQQKITELEQKIDALEIRLPQSDSENTFSRDSDHAPAEVPEARPVYTSKSSHAIMEDPLIKEIYERKKLIFRRKERDSSDAQLLASPTMTSTVRSNKLA